MVWTLLWYFLEGNIRIRTFRSSRGVLDSIALLLHPRSIQTIRWTGLTLSTCLIFSQTELTWSSQGEGREAGLKSLESELPMCAGGKGNIPHGERHFSSIEEKPNVTVTC